MSTQPKYIVSHQEITSERYSEIENDDELKTWLEDGSLFDGDLIFTISEIRQVAPVDRTLTVKPLVKKETIDEPNP